MPNLKPSEDKFYKALREIFIGAKIEGKGGYVNLMNIKSRYFEEVLLKGLWNYIDELFPTDKEELFSKLYTFFSRYFSETGSICFQYTPLKENIYERVYTNKDDVVLFYKTHMLYYVKSEKIWKSLDISIKDDNTLEEILFSFDASEIELAKNNEKKEVIFSFQKVQDSKVYMSVGYSKNATISKYDEIIKEAKKGHKDISLEILDRAISVYKKQTEVDFFINKNANSFLKEQWDLWMYQYVFQGETDWTSGRIGTLQKIKDVVYKLIDYISQFEDELVKIWNKPKFVRDSNYVINLKSLKDYLLKVNKEDEMKYILEEIDKELTKKADYYDNMVLILKEKYRNIDMISSIVVDDIQYKNRTFYLDFLRKKAGRDEIVIENGIIYQLNKKEKKKELGKFIKKTEEDGDDVLFFPLSDNDFQRQGKMEQELYKQSINIDTDLMEVFLDTKYFDNDFRAYLLGLFEDIDGMLDGILVKSDNYQALNTILPKYRGEVDLFWTDPPFNTENPQFIYKDNFKDSSWLSMMDNRLYLVNQILSDKGSVYVHLDENADYLCRDLLNKYFIFRNEIIAKHFGGRMNAKKKIYEAIHDTILFYTKSDEYSFNYLLIEGEGEEKYRFITTVYDKYLTTKYSQFNYKENAFGYKVGETTQKTEDYLQKYVRVSSKKGETILDIFAGTGTTLSVAHKMNRKWIGIEMGEHYDKITVNRMKKVLIGDMAGVSKEEDIQWQGGGFFKYYSLEQYEEALEKSVYGENVSLFDDSHTDPYSRYVFLADEKMTRSIERDEKSGKVKVDLSKLYPDIDIPETLSHILGKKIKTIREGIVTFVDGQAIDTNDLDYNIIKPLIWWK